MNASAHPDASAATFLPPAWLANPHLQTMLANWPGDRQAQRHLVPEDFLVPLRSCADQLLGVAYGPGARGGTVVVVHGVGGSSESSYVMRAVEQLVSAGFHVVALNLRGAGRGARYAEKMYHSGLISDLEDALFTIRKRRPHQPIGLLGFSLGGQIALRLAATWESRTRAAAQALVTISSPFDLDAACARLDAGPRWPYRHHILVGLKANCARPAPSGRRKLPLSMKEIGRITSLRHFDDVITAPMHGFANARAFYKEVSCGPHLGGNPVPTLSVHAKDDPVVSIDNLRPYVDRASAQMKCLWTPRGGHVGFIAGWRHERRSWAVLSARRFFEHSLR